MNELNTFCCLRFFAKEDWLRELVALKGDHFLLVYNYNNLIDGGNTDEILKKFEDSWSIDQWNLRNELLEKSPYLSVDVLVELVHSEKLPLVMCAEVLLANPDATKQQEFVYFMTHKPTYLTPLAKQLVEDSWNTTTFRTVMESSISEKVSEIEQTQRGIIGLILNEEEVINIDEYRNVLYDMNNLSANLELVDSYIGTKEYDMAINLLKSLQGNEEIMKDREEEINDYLTYVYIVANKGSAGLNDALLPLSENNTKAGRKAKSILQFNGVVNDYHPLIVPTEEFEKKAARIKGSLEDLMSADIMVQPNPAKDYISITYNLNPQSTYIFKLTDNTGKIILTEPLKDSKGLQTIDTRNLKSGSYIYSVENNNKVIKSDKIIIVK